MSKTPPIVGGYAKSKAENSYNLSKFLPESEQEATQLKWIQREFDRWDKDNSGAIDEQEFAAIFNFDKEQYCIPYAEKLFHYFDMDSSGEIDFREFVFGMSQLPMPSASNAPVKFLFQLFAVNSLARKEHLYGIVQDSAGTDRRTRGGASVNGALDAIARVPKDRLNYSELEEIMVEHEEAFTPLLVLWDVVCTCVAPCRAVKKGMASNVWLKDYFSDLEVKMRKQTNPARSIDELMKQKRKPEARAKLQKGMKTVLASVRMNMLMGGKGAADLAGLTKKKEEPVYQIKAPSFCPDEMSSFEANRASRSSEKNSKKGGNATAGGSVWGDPTVVGGGSSKGTRPPRSKSSELVASPGSSTAPRRPGASGRGSEEDDLNPPRAASPDRRASLGRSSTAGRAGGDKPRPGGGSKWSFVKKQVKPAALASKLFGRAVADKEEGGGGGGKYFGKSSAGKYRT